MNRSMVAGIAFVAGIAIATPMVAWSADNPPQSAQSAPPQITQPGPPQIGIGPGPAGRVGPGMMGGNGPGPAGRVAPGMMGGSAPGIMGGGVHGMRGGGVHGMMGGGEAMMGHPGWMHDMSNRSPQERCTERLARRAGVIAYTIAKLNLTAEQKPLWDKVQSQLQAAADKQRQLCASLKPAAEQAQQTILDRMNRREQFLSARLDALHQVRPAVEACYQALTPEQKEVVNHPFRH